MKHQHELARIALGEFQNKLVQQFGALAGQVAGLKEIQAALPVDAALVAWVDLPRLEPNMADPRGEHWGVVVRSRGIPAWVRIAGTGPDGVWTADDRGLAERVWGELRNRPSGPSAAPRPLLAKLRSQRLDPLEKALGRRADGQPPVRRIIVLPSRAPAPDVHNFLAAVPIETLLAPDDGRTVSYAPSATVLKYLREQPRPDRHASLLALGDPVFDRPDRSSEPPPPDHGLLVNSVLPGSNAATHGLKGGDVLLAYDGKALEQIQDLKVLPEPGQAVAVEVWRAGKVVRREVARGKLGAVIETRPAPAVMAEKRRLEQALLACGGPATTFHPCPAPGLRSRPWPRSSRLITGRPGSCWAPRQARARSRAWLPLASWPGSRLFTSLPTV